MKNKYKRNFIIVALATVLAFTPVRAADITPAETKAIAEDQENGAREARALTNLNWKLQIAKIKRSLRKFLVRS